MTCNKFSLLAASAVISAFGAGAAQAQFAFPTATIVGAGASLPQNVARQAGDCYGIKTTLGFGVSSPSTAPTPSTLADFNYTTTGVASSSNTFNCASRDVQPAITVRYLSTGSGAGVTAFLTNRVASTINFSSGYDTYVSADGYQYSFSETPLSATNLTSYNNTLINPFTRYGTGTVDPVTLINSAPVSATAAALFGAPIQIPVVVAAVAVGYSPVYAKVRNADGTITSHRFRVGRARADGSGGLQLTRAQYCGIFNGTITNWNQLPTSVVNKASADTATFNVPIRLVGRSETSGTTSLFTRAMAAQCSGLSVATGLGGTGTPVAISNKFGDGENRLPYSGTPSVTGTAYTSANPAGTVSPTNSLSGAFFNKATGAITIGTEAVGLFTVANGNDGVALATAFHPDPSVTIGDRTLNGRINYVSPEQTLPAAQISGANTLGLHTASLQVNGTGSVFVAPTADQASLAFGSVKPPQSSGTSGAYCTGSSACSAGSRDNPLNWVAASDKTAALALPTVGYPIVGTSNALLYTCYATPARRQAVNGYFATLMAKTLKNSVNVEIPTGLATDVFRGIFAKQGLAGLPTAWRNAITETFLTNSVQLGRVGDATSRLGLRNLWIQDKIPSAATGTFANTRANALCTGKPGA